MKAGSSLAILGFAYALAACSKEPPAQGFTPETEDDASAVAPAEDAGPAATVVGTETTVAADASGDADPLAGWRTGDGSAAAAAEAGTIAVQSLNVSVGPIPVAAGEETTVCITLKLNNPEAIFVPRITATLAPGSHHLVVYRSNATTENLTPTACTAFQGVIDGSGVPMLIAQTLSAELTFPQGVAIKLQPQQMIMLEAHYIDTGSADLMGQGSVTIESLPATTPNIIESDVGFYGTYNILIPPMSQGTVGPLFVPGLAGTHGFALTTHQHRLGSRFRVWYANSASDTNHTPVADTTDWSNAPLYMMDPPLDFNGSNGLAYECQWNNTTDSLITFGESALQEMCFMWMYYYPSHGFDMRTQ
jgi:hypothetical protein